MAKKEILLKVRCSRKRFILLYILMFFIIATLFYFTFIERIELNKTAWISSLIFLFFGLIYPEYYIIKDWWAVTPTGIIQSLGLLNKNIREIDFSSISDLDLEQPLLKRIINFGNVNVRLFLNETSISIKDINNPDIFIERLQEIISKNRNQKHALRNI